MKKPHKFAPAFTVVEILIASAIMAVLVAVILGITSSVLTAWNNASNSLSRNFESRVSLDLIVQDLEAALFRSDGSIWMVSQAQPVTNDAIGNGTFEYLKFFTVAPDRPEGPGDVSAVAYFVANRNPFGSSTGSGTTLNLYRVVLDGKTTFEDVLGNLDSPATDALLVPSNDAGFSAAFLANNVIEFRVEFTLQTKTTNSTGGKVVEQYLTRTINSGFFSPLGVPDNKTPSPPPGGIVEFPSEYNGQKIQKPLYADVYIRIIDDEGLRILEADAAPPSGTTEFDDFIRSHSELFSRRVHFINNPI